MTESPSSSKLSKFLPSIILSIVLAGGGYVVTTIYIGWEDLWHHVYSVGLAGVGIALSFTTVALLIRFKRWHLFLRVLGCKISWKDNLQIYLAGFAFTTTPAKAGELVRSLFLKKYKMSYTSSVAALVAERTMDLMVMLGLVMLGGLSHPQGKVVSLFALLIILALMAFLGFQGVLSGVRSIAVNMEMRRTTSLIEKAIRLSEQFRLCARGQALWVGIVLGTLAWTVEGAGFFIICHIVLDQSPAIGEAIFIYAFATLAGALSFLPGGLGVAEVTMFALLVNLGASNEEAAAITIVTRLVTLWYGVGIGAIMLSIISAKAAAARTPRGSGAGSC